MDQRPPFLKNLLPIVAGLSSVRRYSMVTMSRDESVLEHLGMVALTSMVIGVKLELSASVMGDLLSKALCHDLEEVIWGDIARPTKHHSPESRQMFSRMSEVAVARVEKMLGIYLGATAREAKSGATGSIVALADMLAVVYKVWDEVVVRGNVTMVRQAVKVEQQLISFRGESVARHWSGRQFTVLIALIDEAVEVARQAAKMNRTENYFIEETIADED